MGNLSLFSQANQSWGLLKKICVVRTLSTYHQHMRRLIVMGFLAQVKSIFSRFAKYEATGHLILG